MTTRWMRGSRAGARMANWIRRNESHLVEACTRRYQGDSPVHRPVSSTSGGTDRGEASQDPRPAATTPTARSRCHHRPDINITPTNIIVIEQRDKNTSVSNKRDSNGRLVFCV